MRSRNRAKRKQEMHFGAAMADLALLLLVFFMVTSNPDQTSKKGITLPGGLSDSDKQNKAIIVLDNKGTIFMDKKSLTETELIDALKVKNIRKDDFIGLISDRLNPYGKVRTLLSLLAENNYQKIKFHTISEQ